MLEHQNCGSLYLLFFSYSSAKVSSSTFRIHLKFFEMVFKMFCLSNPNLTSSTLKCVCVKDYFEREEHECTDGGGAERVPIRFHTVRLEPSTGLELMHLKIMT